MSKISGSGVALVTPFDNNNDINYDKLKELIEYHIMNKTDFIVICGTTGEASTLSTTEKRKLMKKAIEFANGRIPIICGTGSNNTKDAIHLSTYAKEIGADGILVVTPYYNKGNESGIIEHYTSIAKAVYPLDVILYNVPSRTGVDLSIDTIYTLSNVPNIIGIKEASPSLEKIERIILKCDDNFKVFSGNDNLSLPILSVGGVGVISVAANIIPYQMHKICLKNDLELFKTYLPLMNSLFNDVNPILIKEAMNILKFDVGKTRLPLGKTKEDNIEILTDELKKVHML